MQLLLGSKILYLTMEMHVLWRAVACSARTSMLAWSFVDGWIGLCFLPHLIHALSLGILLNTIPNPSISPMAILGMCSFLGEAIDI